jgi:HK97 family phage prohead protease
MIARRFPNGTEFRAVAELRTAEGRKLIGYAAVFNSPARIGGFMETIKPGAFRASLSRPEADVLALVDHDVGRLLARTRSGTLRLEEDARGLRFDLDIPDTQLGHDVLALAQRGDLGGASIGFRPVDEAWPARDQRELRALDLVEISIVHAHPAYAETSVAARASLSRLNTSPSQRRRRFLDMLG